MTKIKMSVVLSIMVLLIGCAGKHQTTFRADDGNPTGTNAGLQQPVPNRTAVEGMAWVAVSIDPTLKIHRVVSDQGWGTFSPSADGKVWIQLPVLGYYQVNVYLESGLPSVARSGDNVVTYFNVYVNGVALEQVVVGRRQGTDAQGQTIWLNDAVNYRFQIRADGSIDPRPPVSPNYQGR